MAFSTTLNVTGVPLGFRIEQRNGLTIINWETTRIDRYLKLGNLYVHFLR